jgi:hypothetical protein
MMLSASQTEKPSLFSDSVNYWIVSQKAIEVSLQEPDIHLSILESLTVIGNTDRRDLVSALIRH